MMASWTLDVHGMVVSLNFTNVYIFGALISTTKVCAVYLFGDSEYGYIRHVWMPYRRQNGWLYIYIYIYICYELHVRLTICPS